MPKKTLEEWEDIHAKFYKKYNRLGIWQKENYRTVCETGEYSSFTGRRYVFHKQDGVYSKPAVCNYIVQGTATGDIVPFAMMLIRKQIRDLELDAKMICQVHDSVVLDVHKNSLDDVAEVVYNVFVGLRKTIKQYWGYDWIVPLTGCIEIGKNYKDLQEIYNKRGKIKPYAEIKF